MKNKKLYLTLGAVGVLLVAVVAVVALQGKGGNLSGYLGGVTNPTASNSNANLGLRPLPTPSILNPNLKLSPPDTTAPTVTMVYPSDGMKKGDSQTMLVRAVASDNIGVTKVEFRSGLAYILAGTATKPDNHGEYSHLFDLLPSNNNILVLSVWAYDAAGNIGKKTISINVDNIGPDLNVTPKSGDKIDMTVQKDGTMALIMNVNVDASDPSGLQTATFSLDGGGETIVDFLPYKYSLTVATYAPSKGELNISPFLKSGSHTIKIMVKDGAGNNSTKVINFHTSPNFDFGLLPADYYLIVN